MSKCILPIRFIDLKGNGLHLLVKARINGRSAVLVLDTGASKTVIDKKRSESFFPHDHLKRDDRTSSGLGTNSMESYHAVLGKFQLGDFLLQQYHVTLLDLSHVNIAYDNLGLKPVDGVLGSDLLHEFSAVIDYSKKTLLLQKKATKTAASKKSSGKKSATKKAKPGKNGKKKINNRGRLFIQ